MEAHKCDKGQQQILNQTRFYIPIYINATQEPIMELLQEFQQLHDKVKLLLMDLNQS